MRFFWGGIRWILTKASCKSLSSFLFWKLKFVRSSLEKLLENLLDFDWTFNFSGN